MSNYERRCMLVADQVLVPEASVAVPVKPVHRATVPEMSVKPPFILGG